MQYALIQERPRCSELPGVDEFDSRFFEVGDVSGGERGTQVPADGRDLRVSGTDKPADPLPDGNDVRVPDGGALMEGKHPAAEVLGQDPADHHSQLSLAVPVRKPRNAVAQLGRSDRSRCCLGDLKQMLAMLLDSAQPGILYGTGALFTFRRWPDLRACPKFLLGGCRLFRVCLASARLLMVMSWRVAGMLPLRMCWCRCCCGAAALGWPGGRGERGEVFAAPGPGSHPFPHQVIRFASDSVAAVVHSPGRGVLMLYRHRFITGATGLAVPAGGISPGENPVDAASREVFEETGSKLADARMMASADVLPGAARIPAVRQTRSRVAYSRKRTLAQCSCAALPGRPYSATSRERN